MNLERTYNRYGKSVNIFNEISKYKKAHATKVAQMVEQCAQDTINNRRTLDHNDLGYRKDSISQMNEALMPINERLDLYLSSVGTSLIEDTKQKKVTPKIKVSNIVDGTAAYNKNFTFPSENGYLRKVSIFKYFTNNCQLSSVSEAQSLLSCDPTLWDELMMRIKSHSNRQLLFDINTDIKDALHEKIKDRLLQVLTTDYISTNGSEMSLMIYKWKE